MKEDSHKECLKSILPIQDALDVLNGKWRLPIILAIMNGNKRFKEIERQIPKISAKMLSKELKELELNLLVKRTVYDSLPVTVEYTLTPYAKTLHEVIMTLRSWGVLHRKKMTGK